MNRNKLIEDNMNLVYYVIHRYFPKYAFDEDVAQEGMVALTKAANTYDETKSKFSTYATWAISNGIKKYLRKQKRQIKTMSLDTCMSDYELDGEVSLGDIVPDESVEVDFELLYDEDFFKILKDKDKTLISMTLDGYSRTDIARVLNCGEDYITKRRRLLKQKWREFDARN